MKPDILESERLILRPISMEHESEEYVSWLNDPEVIRFLETGGNYSIAQLHEFLLGVTALEILFWGIHLKTGKHIGNIKIDPVNTRHGFGEYGILMGDRLEWGKGYAKEATLSVIEYCFQKIGLRKINLGVVKDNQAALGLYKRLGFLVEGNYLNHGIYNGKYCDIVRMAIFNPAFSYGE